MYIDGFEAEFDHIDRIYNLVERGLKRKSKYGKLDNVTLEGWIKASKVVAPHLVPPKEDFDTSEKKSFNDLTSELLISNLIPLKE